MTKRLLAAALFVPFLALAHPQPALAYTNFSFAVAIPGIPFFGAAVGVPAPYYAPPPCGAPAYLPAPVYAPAPVYVPGAGYSGPVFYGPRRVYGPVYRSYRARAYYGRGYRRW